MAVWSAYDPDDVLPAAIQAARYSVATGTWSSPVDLAVDARTDVHRVVDIVIAGDDLGNAVAAWIRRGSRRPWIDRTNPDVLQVARYSAASDTWDAALTISEADPSGNLQNLAIAGSPSGEVVMVWTRLDPNSTAILRTTMQSARYSAARGTWRDPVDVADARAQVITVDTAGNAMAMWVAGGRIQAARNITGTETWTSVTSIDSAEFGDGVVKTYGAGNAIAVWVEDVKDQPYDPSRLVIKSARYTSSTATWSAPVTLSPPGRWHNLSPDLVVDADGDAVAIWEFQSGTRHGIHAIRYTVESGTWGDGVDLVNDGSWHYRPVVAVDSSGNITAAWTVVEGVAAHILAARRPAGGTWDAPVIIRRRWIHFEGASLSRQLPVDQAGNVTLVWKFHHSPAAGDRIESTRWLARATPTPGPPSAPTNVGATVSGSIIGLSWGAPASGDTPTSYSLVARLTAGGPVVATLSMGAQTSFSVNAPNGTFVLSVRASNANGTGPESTSLTVTVPQAVPPPGPPSNLAASVTGTTVSFSWSAPASGGALTNYVLVAGLTPGFSVPYVTMALGSTPGVGVPGVPPGTYYVRVLAQNASGIGAASNEVVVTVAGAAVPGTPTLHPPVVTGSTVALSWSAGAGDPATHYTLIASVTPGGAPIATVPLVGTAISFSDVPPGTYYLQLTASNVAGTSPPAQVTLSVP